MEHEAKAFAKPIASAMAVLAVASMGQAQADTAEKTGVDAAPYTASNHPGVMVRNAPDATAAAKTSAAGTHKGWIYVKPGAKPHIRPRVGTRGAGIWYEKGKTSAGGMIAHVTPRFYPYHKATATKAHVKRKIAKAKTLPAKAPTRQ